MDELHVLAEGPFRAEQVRVTWVHGPVAMSDAARVIVQRRWAHYEQAAQAAGKSLFDGKITRLIAAERAGEMLELTMGPATYSEFVVTTLRDRMWFMANEPAAMVAATGNSVLITHGDGAILGVRSRQVSAYAGRVHLFGGVLDLLGGDGRSAAGLVEHLERELREELSLMREELVGEPRLLAVVRDNFLMQPELIWQWETRAALADVVQRVDPQEHDGVVTLGRERPGADVWAQMTPVARAAWLGWQKKMP